ncbi:MAG: T9SS C-terminal target domain-containing protein [Verrucomicrobiota bacterium]
MFRNLKSRLTIALLCTGLLGATSTQAATIQVTANLTGTNTWRSTNEYVLNGFIYVLQGGVLNIEPGTVIRGKAGTGLSSSALFITRGAKIFANGTEHSPIIFTSESDDLDDPTDLPLWQRGLWGGVVIFGNCVLNTASDVTGNGASPKYDIFEGLPDTQISGQFVNRMGGNDDNDSSGVFRYVSIRHAGTVILPNKELNGLSLAAVGRGTKIENVEVYGTADDSVEFFGGTVNTKYIASFFSDDDNFDIDQGYRGKNQFWFVLQAPDAKDNGGEWNGEPNGLGVGASPTMNFELYNATYIGAGSNGTPTRALIPRVYAAPKVFNSIFTEFGGDILNIDATSGAHFTNGLAKIQNNIFWNLAINGSQVLPPATSIGYWVITNSVNSNDVVNPLLTSVSRTNFPAFKMDPRPQAGSPALTSSLTAPNDGFYTPVSYKGAFKDINWASEWGVAAEVCLMSGEAAGTPLPLGTVVVPPPSAVILSIVKNGANVDVTFVSQSGYSYQLQTRADLQSGTWGNLGSAVTGTGGILTISAPLGADMAYFRVSAN